MNLENEVPILVLDILEADVSQDTGVVDQNIDTTKALDRGVDNLVAVFYGVIVCNGLAAGILYFIDDYIGGLVGRKGQLREKKELAGQVLATTAGTNVILGRFSPLRNCLRP